MVTVCDTKVLYDTEFEAELAANRQYDAMYHYRCPGTRHYHIAHVKKQERQGYGYGWGKCPGCKKLYKTKQLKKHQLKCKEILTNGTKYQERWFRRGTDANVPSRNASDSQLNELPVR